MQDWELHVSYTFSNAGLDLQVNCTLGNAGLGTSPELYI